MVLTRSMNASMRIGHLCQLRYLRRVNSRWRLKAVAAMATWLATLPINNFAATTTPAAGETFNSRGKVVLHRGEPCTSQIMFDFHPLNSKAIIWMAAGAHDSAKLTEAAGAHRRLRITGTWKRGQHAACAYVEVKKLVLERSWLESLFKP